MQALSRTKGRLSIDFRAQSHDKSNNPYLGMHLVAKKPQARPAEVEVFEKDTNFRKLQVGVNGQTNHKDSTKSGKKLTTMQLIEESKERIKEKRLSKDKMKVKEEIDVDELENKYRIRFSHISPHIV